MSASAKAKIIQFRVTEQDFSTLSRLAEFLHQKGDIDSTNPHMLAKQYTFAFANIVLKMHGLTDTSEQDNAIFALAKGMASTLNPEGSPNG